MILCLSFERGMVDMCIPGMFLILGRRACCHSTCGEIGNKKLTLPVPAADATTQGGSATCFCILRPARSPMGKGRFLLAPTRLHEVVAKGTRFFQKSNVCLLLRFHHPAD